jgi:hypothetical protein
MLTLATLVFLLFASSITSLDHDTHLALAEKASRVGAGLQAKVFGGVTLPAEAKADADYFIKHGIVSKPADPPLLRAAAAHPLQIALSDIT